MKSPIAVTLLVSWLLALPAPAESHFGSIAFSSDEIVGTLHFTALAPGDTSSGFAPFAGYSQGVSADYTYLYRVDNDSAPGAPTPFGNEHSFTDLDLLTLLDPNNLAQIYGLGFDASNGGEAPSAIDPTTVPNDIDYQFDSSPNFGIPPADLSAFLFFSSPFAPTDQGGALVTNNLGNSASIASGVTTPIPEPATGLLLLAGLLGLGIHRRVS